MGKTIQCGTCNQSTSCCQQTQKCTKYKLCCPVVGPRGEKGKPGENFKGETGAQGNPGAPGVCIVARTYSSNVYSIDLNPADPSTWATFPFSAPGATNVNVNLSSLLDASTGTVIKTGISNGVGPGLTYGVWSITDAGRYRFSLNIHFVWAPDGVYFQDYLDFVNFQFSLVGSSVHGVSTASFGKDNTDVFMSINGIADFAADEVITPTLVILNNNYEGGSPPENPFLILDYSATFNKL